MIAGDQKSLKLSLIGHGSLLLLLTVLAYFNHTAKLATSIEIPFFVEESETPIEKLKVIDNPQIKKNNKIALSENSKTEIPPTKPVREVFGLNRKALTASGESGVAVKLGNTIMKENDNLTLNKDDADSVPADIPTPAEDYLVTEMPRVLNEYRAPYPAKAKEKGIEGAVILDIIIDEKGKVRWAKLISGPGFGLNEAALESIYKFQFSPAKIELASVAVKIRYSIRFVLEK